jgi:diguanylate cyclase (GGDEF)-like protein
MLNLSKISTNILLASVASSLMVVWLGSRFVSDAHTQFAGALQLQQSIAPETKLFEVADSLDAEQAQVQNILISSIGRDGEIAKLNDLARETRFLFAEAKEETLASRRDASESAHYRYSDESIESLLDNLEDKFKRKALMSSVITSQIYRPIESRDDTIRMRLFDAHTDTIAAVNNLRKRTFGLLGENYHGVLADQEVKDALWNFKSSINQTTNLVISYLAKAEKSALETLNRENLSLRVLQLEARAEQSLTDLTDMVQGKIIIGLTAEAVNQLNETYNKEINPLLKNIKLSVNGNTELTIDRSKWQLAVDNTKSKLDILTDLAIAKTHSRVDSIQNRAIKSLAINALLVLAYIGVIYFSFRVAKKIQHQADHDHLTGLTNRRKFSEILQSRINKTDTNNHYGLVLMTMDLNGFKTINDTMGHSAGDTVLIEVAERLKSVATDNMSLSRLGGDEFGVCFTIQNSQQPLQIVSRITEAFEPLFAVYKNRVKLGVSIGYSVYPKDATSIEQLQITSDFAMFCAKQSGTKSIQPYNSEIAAQFEHRISIEKDLRSAIANNELELYYQPQFNLDSNKVDAAEALIRWNHPTRGMVPPFEFIEIAEECGLMPEIGAWVIEEACRQLAVWNNRGDITVRLAVNVSVHQITQPEFVELVLHTMDRYQVSPKLLELEITESVIISDIDLIVNSLRRLKAHGLRIALDDFGTGYSSLSQLQALPLDTLKIDRSFISQLDETSSSVKSVTETIVAIAKTYGLETVAEGIETTTQLDEVIRLGINVAQGYHYSKPLPKNEFIDSVAAINAQAEIDTRQGAA